MGLCLVVHLHILLLVAPIGSASTPGPIPKDVFALPDGRAQIPCSYGRMTSTVQLWDTVSPRPLRQDSVSSLGEGTVMMEVTHQASWSPMIYTCVLLTVTGEKLMETTYRVSSAENLGCQIPPAPWYSGAPGSAVLIPCIPAGKPTPRMELHRGAYPIGSPKAYAMERGVVLLNPSSDDTGNYKLVLTNEAGDVSFDVHIDVHEWPTDTEVVRVQQQLNFTTPACLLGELGLSSEFSWLRGFTALSSDQPRCSILNSSQLVIQSVDVGDQGAYTCRSVYSKAVRSKVEFTFTIYLEVLYQPEVLTITGPAVVLVGRSFRLDCVVIGTKPLEIHWSLNGHLLDSLKDYSHFQAFRNGSLVVLNATLNFSGVYRCLTNNSYGSGVPSSFQLDVQQPPYFLHPIPTTLVVAAGKPAQVTCSAGGVPPPVVEWVRYDASEQFRVVSAAPTLMFGQVAPGDEARYACRASSPSGSAHQFLKLDVVDIPPAPISISVLPVGSNGTLLILELSWSTQGQMEHMQTYEVVYRKVSSSLWKTLGHLPLRRVTLPCFNRQGEPAEFSVRATNLAGTSNFSDVLHCSFDPINVCQLQVVRLVPAALPPPPSSFEVVNKTTYLELSWEHSDAPGYPFITHFTLNYRQSQQGDDWLPLATLGPQDLSYNITDPALVNFQSLEFLLKSWSNLIASAPVLFRAKLSVLSSSTSPEVKEPQTQRSSAGGEDRRGEASTVLIVVGIVCGTVVLVVVVTLLYIRCLLSRSKMSTKNGYSGRYGANPYSERIPLTSNHDHWYDTIRNNNSSGGGSFLVNPSDQDGGDTDIDLYHFRNNMLAFELSRAKDRSGLVSLLRKDGLVRSVSSPSLLVSSDANSLDLASENSLRYARRRADQFFVRPNQVSGKMGKDLEDSFDQFFRKNASSTSSNHGGSSSRTNNPELGYCQLGVLDDVFDSGTLGSPASTKPGFPPQPMPNLPSPCRLMSPSSRRHFIDAVVRLQHDTGIDLDSSEDDLSIAHTVFGCPRSVSDADGSRSPPRLSPKLSARLRNAQQTPVEQEERCQSLLKEFRGLMPQTSLPDSILRSPQSNSTEWVL